MFRLDIQVHRKSIKVRGVDSSRRARNLSFRSFECRSSGDKAEIAVFWSRVEAWKDKNRMEIRG